MHSHVVRHSLFVADFDVGGSRRGGGISCKSELCVSGREGAAGVRSIDGGGAIGVCGIDLVHAAGCRRFEAGCVRVNVGAEGRKIERGSVLRHPELVRDSGSAVGPVATGLPGLLVRTGVRAPFAAPSIRDADRVFPGQDFRRIRSSA